MVTFWGAGGAQHLPPEHCQLPAPTNCSVGGDKQASARRRGLCHRYGHVLLYGLKIRFLILSDYVSYAPF